MNDLDDQLWDDEEDDDDYPYGPNGYDDGWDSYDPETSCIACGKSGCMDNCECCGAPLCHMHSECGAGFCPSCPTADYRPGYLPETLADKLRRALHNIKNMIPRRATAVQYFSDEEIPF